MDTLTLTYEDRPAALAARERFWLAAHVEALPDGHPTKRLVAFMALYARDVLAGELPAPYSDERARRFARLALVEPLTYEAHHQLADNQLAAVLRLPLAEMPHVRREQHAAVAAGRQHTRRRRGRAGQHARRQHG